MNNSRFKKLNIGDTIGIISPSGNIKGEEKNVQVAIDFFKKRGFKIKIGDCFNKKTYSSSGTRYERVKEINKMFADSEVRVIFCTIGGDTANQVIDLIDYSLIKKNPKPIIGFSDNTHLLIAINKKTGIKTFHGPNLSTISNLTKDSLEQMFNVLSGKIFDTDFFSECDVIKEGKTRGLLIGGNLLIINALNKTEFSPDYKDKILFWEDIDEGLSDIEYQLYQLHLSGILGKISGMIIGHIENPSKDSRPFREIVLELTKEHNYPILKTDCFGHGIEKFYTFPIGSEVKIDTDKKFFTFSS